MHIDVHDQTSYEHSISNLAALKLIHDEGVDVTKICTHFMVHVNTHMDAGYDILVAGVNELFQSAEIYDSEIEDEDDYKELVEDGLGDSTLIIKDSLFERVLNGIFGEEFETILTKSGHALEYSDCEFRPLPLGNGIAVLMTYPGMIHELVKEIISLKHHAIKFDYRAKEMNSDGVSYQNHKRTA
ncbi:hypothetical protein [Bacillus alkalicellulosilyticus]|uniref:hypothetical protein n=1 Tax=Alkalihalobacterium alkalicellulosilyticum TaxID=1912214 RepID=UPI000998601E|nr:hypothetical protein [Bacillus alkalicellulosilyticus]